MPFRPALPMDRSNLRCLGLSVGIAIALSGCGAREASDVQYSIAGYIAEGVTDNPEAVAAARLALSDGLLTQSEYAQVRALDDADPRLPVRKREVIRKWRASGMSASGQDPQGLEAKPASPVPLAGDAQ
jgi:hypothetical protein